LSSKPLSHQVGILTLGRVFAFGVMLFVPVVNSRALSLDHYGYYHQFWLMFETVTPMFILGFPRSLLYYFPRADSREEKSIYVTQTVFYLFVAAIAAVVVYGILGKTLGPGLGGMIRAFYWRLCFFTVCMLLSRHMEELFVADRQIERQSVWYVVTASMRAGVVMVVSWYTRNVDAIIWALAVYSGVRAAFALVYTKVVYRPSLRQVSFPTIREQLSFALPLGMMGIATLLLTQTDKFIITRYLGRDEFAIYAQGAFQLPFVMIIASSVANVAFPVLARYQKDGKFAEFLDLWKRAWLKTAVLFFPLFVFFMATAEQFIVIMFTEKFITATPVFRLYLVLFLKATTDYGGVLTAFKKQDYLFRILAVAIAANLVLSLVLFHFYGRLGVPVSTLITFFAVGVLAVRKGGHLLGKSFRQVVPWNGLTARMACAVAPGVALYVLYGTNGEPAISVYATAAIAYFAAYFALCWVFRLLNWEDVRSLLGR
jgi:O-antigen/teichoic acid export membrane protein